MKSPRWVIWGLVFAFWSLVALLGLSQIYVESVQMREPFQWKLALIRSFPPYYLWALLTPLIFWLGSRFRLDRVHWRSSLAVHLVAGGVFAFIHLVAMAALSKYVISTQIPNASFQEASFGEVLQFYFVLKFHLNVLTYAAVLGIGYAFDYYSKYREREIRTSQLEAQLAKAQLQALRMQLHPHFLFNTLHAISALMDEDVHVSRRILTLLSELLRIALDKSEDQEVSLQQELAFVERYLEIQRIRFRNQLDVSIQVTPEALQARVPNLILQPLVENAIQHGAAPKGKVSQVAIRAFCQDGTLTLQVDDNGPGLPRVGRHPVIKKGIGLRNTEERLQQLYGTDQLMTFEDMPDGGLRVILQLPHYTDVSKLEIIG